MTDLGEKNTNKNFKEKDLFNSQSNNSKPKIRTEKKVFVFLVILVLAALSLGIWQISSQLSDPFYPEVGEDSSNSQLSDTTETKAPRIENLRTKDTDQDGLTDYEELYMHKTSPYIADSDSDKINDKAEIDQGTDPNCPAGVICSREAASDTSGDLTMDDLSNLSADQVRDIMRDAGASEQLLSQISDEELLQTYLEVLETESTNFDTITNTATTNTTTNDQQFSYETLDYDTLFNLEPSAIRQLMIEGGVPEDALNEIDDDTLQQIYQESLADNLDYLIKEAP